MASYLQELIDQTISVITNDGRNIIVQRMDSSNAEACSDIYCAYDCLMQGVLKGYDQCINVILDDSFERVFSLKEPVEAVELGLYIVRGDNICVIGEVSAAIREEVIDDQTRAAPLKPLIH
ncbi:hypothetical protein CCR75_006244 [Bremia lactucae]|uniref:U6 snRNA-associated Sm-like protein LSm8 n=1 Tax=Bremia lactucae TaxID=4779 RepID=A0A976FN49_BRELC|nr:hypothetical protein CCR75_006244 [Bremia lactucae]